MHVLKFPDPEQKSQLAQLQIENQNCNLQKVELIYLNHQLCRLVQQFANCNLENACHIIR